MARADDAATPAEQPAAEQNLTTPSAEREPERRLGANPLPPEGPSSPVTQARVTRPSTTPSSAPTEEVPPAPVHESAETTEPAGSGPQGQQGEVRVKERTLFVLRAARSGLSAEARAKAATQRINDVLAHPETIGAARVELTGDDAVIYVDQVPLLTVGVDDARAAGEASVAVHANQLAAAIDAALAAEKTRSAVATTVFRVSLVVFSALFVFLALRRMNALAERARTRLADEAHPFGGLSVGNVLVASAGTVRATLSAAMSFAHRALQVALVYGWLVFALSLFETTQSLTLRLTGYVVQPLSGMAARLATGLPVLVVFAIAVFALSVFLRFVGEFFASVGRGETQLEWLPRELAKPTSVLVRLGLAVLALGLGAPLITGDNEGTLARAGFLAMAVLGVATLPVLASAALGAPLVFARRLRKNDHVTLGSHSGRVLEVGLLEMRIEDASGAEVRIPHLYGLLHPLRILSGAPLIGVEVVVDPKHSQAKVEECLSTAARKLSARADVELLRLDARGATWRVTSASQSRDKVSLAVVLAEALGEANIGLGSSGREPS